MEFPRQEYWRGLPLPPLCSCDGTGFISCGLCGHVYVGAGPGQSLNCLHSFDRGLGPDLNGSVPEYKAFPFSSYHWPVRQASDKTRAAPTSSWSRAMTQVGSNKTYVRLIPTACLFACAIKNSLYSNTASFVLLLAFTNSFIL